MRINRTIILMACISLLTACAANADTNPVTKNNKQPSKAGFSFSPIAHASTAELLDFINDYTKASKEEQKSIYLEVEQSLTANKDDIKLKIKQAAILALPDSRLRDTKLAQQQLQALLIDQALNKSNKHLVKLLYTFTLDHNAELQKRHDSSKQIDALKKRNKVLGQKLNDLKNIETTMIKRNTKSKK